VTTAVVALAIGTTRSGGSVPTLRATVGTTGSATATGTSAALGGALVPTPARPVRGRSATLVVATLRAPGALPTRGVVTTGRAPAAADLALRAAPVRSATAGSSGPIVAIPLTSRTLAGSARRSAIIISRTVIAGTIRDTHVVSIRRGSAGKEKGPRQTAGAFFSYV
jgi:hypothetical protein